MNKTPDDLQLDALLQSWASDSAARPATLDRLQQSIEAAVRAQPIVKQPSKSPALAVMFTAASLAIATLAAIAFRDQRDTGTTAVPVAANPEIKTRLATLWQESGRLFGSNLTWLGDLDGELLLGVEQTPESSTTEPPVCLSLVLRVFDPSTSTWETSWTGYFTCQCGSAVDFTSSDNRSTGSVWVQSRPDGRFAISHWLNWRDHPGLSGPVDTTVLSDREQIVREGSEGGRRIQIVQQVWRPEIG